MKTAPLQAIIFDMDGVLIDSEPLHLLAMQSFLAAFQIEYREEDNRDFLGRKDLQIAEIIISRHGLPLNPGEFVEGKEKILRELISSKSAARPGVYRLLPAAAEAGIPMAVASSATLGTIRLVMEKLGIGHYFKQLCSGDEVENGKPAPDIFFLAAERLEVQPDTCLVIEDSLNGLKAARSAGMFAVSIPCEATAHQDHSIADLRLSSLEQLPLAELFRAG